MLKKILLLCFTIFLLQLAQGQNFSIKGLLKNAETNAAINGASLTLQSKSDSTLIRRGLSDSAGRFEFSELRKDSFSLIISSVNFATVISTVTIDSADVNIGTLEIRRISEVLTGVTVTANVAPATQKGDTLQLNANQFKVNPDATVEDLAKKMPGITIENGVVKAQGENVQRVTLDGRELFGDDATAALRNLPAEIVDKIQIFDRLSDQAQFSGVDDGNTTKGLNIVTKANMRNGQFGRVYAGYGTDGRYMAGGNTTLLKENRKISIVGNFNNVNQQNFSAQDLLGVTNSGGGGGRGGQGGGRGGGGQGGGNFQFGGNSSNFLVGQQNGINKTNAAGINYTDNWGSKMIVTGSYFYNNTDNSTNEEVNRQYLLKGIRSYNQSTIANSQNTNHRVNMRFEYRIDSSNQLVITPSLSIQKNSAIRNVSTGFLDAATGALQNRTNNINTSDRSGLNLNNSILYRHNFGKRGRTFSVNLNTSSNDRTGDVYTSLFDTTFTGSGTYDDSTSRRFTDQSNSGYNVSANFSYSEPISKNSQLQINYNPSYSKSKADQAAYQYDETSNKYSVFDPTLSSKFNNTNSANNAGLSYRYGTRDNQFNIGLNYQETKLQSDQDFPRPLKVDKSFNNLLPNAMLRLKINAKSNIRFMYRTNTNQPSVTQLQDVYDFTNLPFVTAGNPQLEQQVSQVLNTRYTFTDTKRGILVSGNLFLQQANNYITNATFIALSDSVLTNDLTLKTGQQLTKPVNLDGYVSVRSFATFGVPLKFIKSNINVNAGVNYSKLPGIINNQNNVSKNLTYTLGTVLGSNVSQYVDFTLSYAANFSKAKNEIQPQLNNNYFSHVASLQFNLLSKKGWFFQNDLNNQLYSGLTEGFNQSYFLWNMSAGKKFLKNQKGELKLSVFDLLKQNRSIYRNVTETYIEDVQNQVLQQYFMLTFSYNLRTFGSAPARTNNRMGGGMRMGERPF
jgi:uncharacterized membrane protein YgcG